MRKKNEREDQGELFPNVYKTVVRPALVYGAETWTLPQAQENKLEVADMTMLRWMC